MSESSLRQLLDRSQAERADLANRLCRMGLLRYQPGVPELVFAEMERILTAPERDEAELTRAEWDELVFAADAAEHTVDLASSVYDSIQHALAAILPLHERMIRERIGGEVVRLRAENAALEQALGVPA